VATRTTKDRVFFQTDAGEKSSALHLVVWDAEGEIKQSAPPTQEPSSQETGAQEPSSQEHSTQGTSMEDVQVKVLELFSGTGSVGTFVDGLPNTRSFSIDINAETAGHTPMAWAHRWPPELSRIQGRIRTGDRSSRGT
jgi:hypothetical protein